MRATRCSIGMSRSRCWSRRMVNVRCSGKRRVRRGSPIRMSVRCTRSAYSRGNLFSRWIDVEGRTLGQVLTAGPLPCARVLRYARQIAAAVGHAHDRGVLHKDLKASNVLVTDDDQIKVVDFGIARRIGPSGIEQPPDSRSVALIAGTPAYMAPEVVRGHPADVRSDFWSLGVLLYEMATGARPFRGSFTFQVIAAILDGSPGDLASAVPAPLQVIVGRCLTVDPAARYQSAKEVCAALDSVSSADEEHVPAPIPRPRQRAAAWLRLRGSRVLIASTICFLAMIVALWRGAHIGRDVGTPAQEGSVKRLAVLPFTLSGAQDARTLGIGLADSVISRLATVPSLQVRPSASVQRLDVSQMDIKQLKKLGPMLQVDYLLLVRGEPHGEFCQVRLELVRVADAATEWKDGFCTPRHTSRPWEK